MILNPKFSSNEIAKSSDFEKINEREIKNIEAILDEISAGTTKDSITRGLSVQQRGTPSMNADITAGLGFCISTNRMTYSDSLFGPVAITNGGASNRIDTLEIRLLETDKSQEQRAFKNPSTGAITYQDVYTETEIEIEAQVIAGTEGSGIAPNHTSGWIKIAEIHVDAGESTSILDADIENCSGYYEGEETTLWTAEKDATFITKNLSGIKTLLRNFVNESGTAIDLSGDFQSHDTSINQYGIGVNGATATSTYALNVTGNADINGNLSAQDTTINQYGIGVNGGSATSAIALSVVGGAYISIDLQVADTKINQYGIGVNGATATSSIALNVTGNADISGGIATGGNSAKLAWKVIEIGDWDMSATNSVNVAHGLSSNFVNIRFVSVIIRNDSDTLYYNFESITTSGSLEQRVYFNSSSITLLRDSGGIFDDTFFDTSTSYNRGWVTIGYEV